MDWFQPTTGSITELSIACIESVFLTYLLTLKRKTKDCYLVVLIYLTAAIYEWSAFIVDSTDNPSFYTVFAINLFRGFSMLSIIWCSYRFYKNSFPREFLIAVVTFTVLLGLSVFMWSKDYQLYHHVSVFHVLLLHSLCSASTLLSGINYLRKIQIVSDERGYFPIWKELLHPSTKVIAVLGGFAVSLFIYTIISLLMILNYLNVIIDALFLPLMYLLSVSITTLVAFSYFSYAREQTSFETKLVGITLLITLSVLGLIPVILFGLTGTTETSRYIKAFVFIIPISTLLISFFLPLLFRLTITKHLNKIITGVQSVIFGDLTANVEIEINDEIGRLSHHFNEMTESLRQRTEQLNSMRATIATDFHDQTGNMLSAITRQASLLKVELKSEPKVQPMVECIINNSQDLYASSKDFLWHLNHNSDDPIELFNYLTSYGQLYYNQFDIAFSSVAEECSRLQFDPSAALNLIFIFKEAMTNVVKHAGANEVRLTLNCSFDQVTYMLEDNGVWKQADNTYDHYGLTNMERRCQKNKFGFTVVKQTSGTLIRITAPVHDLNEL